MPKIATSLTLPKYATAPSSPAAGDMFSNTATDTIDVYTGTAWISLNNKLTVVTYTPGSYTWTRPETVSILDYVIALGAGGGGAGGALTSTTATTVSVNGSGGGGSGSNVYIAGLYVGGVSTISIYVPSGGAGGAARTFSKATGATTTSTQAALSGESPSATTFGSYLSAGSGGGGTASSGGAAGVSSYTGYATDLHDGALGAPSPGTSVGQAGDAGFWIIQAQSPTYYLPVLYGNAATTASRTVTSFTGSAAPNGTFAFDGIVTSGGGASGGLTQSSPSNGGIGAYGGGAGAGSMINSPSASSGASATVVAATGGAGALGCGGGGGGPVAVYGNATASFYTNCTLNITSGAGGAGGDGFVIIAYQG